MNLVIDCTGRAVTRSVAELHLERGAKRVLVSGPSKTLDDCDAVLLKGINLESFDPEKHKIISMASCTTNALAPVVKLVRENYGIKYGLFSTVHSYTNTQSLTDQPMKDRRDSWAAAENIIPSSSGAAKALKFIWNDLQITGKAYRIPTRTGSIAELNLITEKPCTVQEINDMFRASRKRRRTERRAGRSGRRMGIFAYRRRSAFIDHRPAFNPSARRTVVRRDLVRQRMGLCFALG